VCEDGHFYGKKLTTFEVKFVKRFGIFDFFLLYSSWVLVQQKIFREPEFLSVFSTLNTLIVRSHFNAWQTKSN
jgi:hypothetical protein